MIQKFKPYVENDYPTSDGRPMAETERHRSLITALIETLQLRYEDEPNTYVGGNLLICYEKGDRRRHISPDVFVVKGVPNHERENYLLWKEEKGPDAVIEVTSKTTHSEDVNKKYKLYRDRLGVIEYFLFDPFEEYLQPSMQGHRRSGNRFRKIKPVAGRLPSEVLGLHLERDGVQLRLWDPETEKWLLNRSETEKVGRLAEKTRADSERAARIAEKARADSERAARIEENARADAAELENKRLRQELDRLRATKTDN